MVKDVDAGWQVEGGSRMFNDAESCWIMLNLYYPTCSFLDFRSLSSNHCDHHIQNPEVALSGNWKESRLQRRTYALHYSTCLLQERDARKNLLCQFYVIYYSWNRAQNGTRVCWPVREHMSSSFLILWIGVYDHSMTPFCHVPGGSSNRRQHAWQCSKRYSDPRTWGGCLRPAHNIRYSFQS